MKTPSNGGRAGRVEKRAVKTMGRAQKNWTKAEAIRKFDKGGSSAVDSPAAAKANKLYDRSARQGEKAKRQMEKANYLKAKKATPQSKLALKKGLMPLEAGEEVGSMVSTAGTRALMKKTTKVSSRVPVKTLTRTTKPMTKRK